MVGGESLLITLTWFFLTEKRKEKSSNLLDEHESQPDLKIKLNVTSAYWRYSSRIISLGHRQRIN